ncbi:hypothetical protein Q0Z83_054220 [Actinoplanes sichuanensis]|nr:hypothetical protein Q0Z83_054220 [Actinoplanes sichuanensis]
MNRLLAADTRTRHRSKYQLLHRARSAHPRTPIHPGTETDFTIGAQILRVMDGRLRGSGTYSQQ